MLLGTHSLVPGVRGPARVGVSVVSGGSDAVDLGTSSYTLYFTMPKSGLQLTYILPS
jgi:hypothetical protein